MPYDFGEYGRFHEPPKSGAGIALLTIVILVVIVLLVVTW
jgi:hypothetical protein